MGLGFRFGLGLGLGLGLGIELGLGLGLVRLDELARHDRRRQRSELRQVPALAQRGGLGSEARGVRLEVGRTWQAGRADLRRKRSREHVHLAHVQPEAPTVAGQVLAARRRHEARAGDVARVAERDLVGVRVRVRARVKVRVRVRVRARARVRVRIRVRVRVRVRVAERDRLPHAQLGQRLRLVVRQLGHLG